MKHRANTLQLEKDSLAKKQEFRQYVLDKQDADKQREKLKEEAKRKAILQTQKNTLNHKSRVLVKHIETMSQCMTTYSAFCSKVDPDLDSREIFTQDFVKALQQLKWRAADAKQFGYGEEPSNTKLVQQTSFPRPISFHSNKSAASIPQSASEQPY